MTAHRWWEGFIMAAPEDRDLERAATMAGQTGRFVPA